MNVISLIILRISTNYTTIYLWRTRREKCGNSTLQPGRNKRNRTNEIKRTKSNERKRTNEIERTKSNKRNRTNEIERTKSNERNRTNEIERTKSNERNRTNEIERTKSNERIWTNKIERTKSIERTEVCFAMAYTGNRWIFHVPMRCLFYGRNRTNYMDWNANKANCGK